jgi:hypothetical protein
LGGDNDSLVLRQRNQIATSQTCKTMPIITTATTVVCRPAEKRETFRPPIRISSQKRQKVGLEGGTYPEQACAIPRPQSSHPVLIIKSEYA